MAGRVYHPRGNVISSGELVCDTALIIKGQRTPGLRRVHCLLARDRVTDSRLDVDKPLVQGLKVAWDIRKARIME